MAVGVAAAEEEAAYEAAAEAAQAVARVGEAPDLCVSAPHPQAFAACICKLY